MHGETRAELSLQSSATLVLFVLSDWNGMEWRSRGRDPSAFPLPVVAVAVAVAAGGDALPWLATRTRTRIE